jgi:hypothetical protein
MYRQAGASGQSEAAYRTISIEGMETRNGREYFRVRYFERTVFLRANEDGSVVVYNATTATEEPWLSPGAAEGTAFETRLDQCTNTGRIESRRAEVDTPAGRFSNAVQISFRGNCADAGTTQQFYAPGVGLVVHEETSFAGPRRYELIYYRAGGAQHTGPEISFEMALDSPRYPAGAVMAVRLTLRSTAAEPVLLQFPSGQSFDLKIHNEAGEIVYTWSADKLFAMVFREERFGPGERTYGFPVPLLNLPPGRYKAEGYLTTLPRMYGAEVSFEITGEPRLVERRRRPR